MKTRVLKNEQMAQYEKTGVLFPLPILSSAEVVKFLSSLEQLEAHLGGCLKRMDQCHLFFPWAYELVTHPNILDVMEDLLGSDLFVHSTRIFYKHPKDPAFVTWHQDGTYSGLNSKPAPSAWIALTNSNVSNGCLRIIPGSHHYPKLSHTETYDANNLLNHGELINIPINESHAINVELKAGQMSLHHVNLVHGSNANTSDTRRIGFAVSYITPAVHYANLPVVRARGRTDAHNFELAEIPCHASVDEALKAHARFVRQYKLQAPKIS